MKRRILAITLSLAMLLGAFAATGLSVGAADQLYVTKATYIPDKVNFLAGKIPTSGWEGKELGDGDASLLTDNAYSKTATDGWQAPFAAGSRLVFNLGSVCTVDTVLIGSVADSAKYVKDFTLYVANDRAQLFTESSLAISSDMLEKGGRITQPGEIIQNGVISILGKSFKGRFVGFDFSSDANAAVFGDTIALGELGVYGKASSSAPVVEMVEDIPFEDNLLLDAILTSGYTGKTPGTSGNTGSIGLITDGFFDTDHNGRWGTPFGDGDRLTWDLGKSATIYKFLIGSEKGRAEWVTKAKIYVSNNKDDLYKENSLQLDLVLTGQNTTVTIQDGSIAGRYVGFDFSANKANILYFFRLGELGVYGMTAPDVSVDNIQDGVELSWTENYYADGYLVERSQLRGDVTWTDWVQVADETTVGYVDTDVVNGQEYRYRIRSYKGEDRSDYSTVVNAKYLAPIAVTAAVASGKVKLSWAANDAVGSYEVYRQQEYDGDWSNWEQIATATLPTYTDGTAENGVKYRYAVSGISGYYVSALKESAVVSKGVALTVPKVKVANATKGIKVTWNKVAGATKYRVYRRTYASGKWSNWTRLTTTSKVSYTDTKAKAGKNYRYMVKAVNGSQTSQYKSTSTIRRLTVPAVKAAKTSKGIKVTWNKVTKAEKYVVYRRTGSGDWKKVKTTTARSYVDKTAKKGKYYSYYVRAINGSSKSYYKATKKVKR